MRKHGLPFREGHHFASEVVSYAKANNIKPLDFPYKEAERIYAETVKGSDYPQSLPMTEAEFRGALDPVAIVKARMTSGGPQPAEMTRMIADAKGKLAAQEAWVGERRNYVETALKKLEGDFSKLLVQ